jgi:uncharacterized protein
MKTLLLLILTLLPLHAELGEKLVAAALQQIGVTIAYDPAYTSLAYPGGDVPLERGVCTDVVIRAMRVALAKDLQQLVHEDMVKNFSAYPHLWDLKRSDKNIDHRRVPNLQTYFKRQGAQLGIEKDPTKFLAGDIVTVIVPPHLPHIMIVSNKKSSAAVPLVIHNIGSGTREEDRLFDFTMTGHYRLK